MSAALGNVYFIRCRRYVKVGFAVDVATRLMELQIGNPYGLEVLATISDAPPSLERLFHRALRKYRARGEWFKLCGPVNSVIDAVKAGARPVEYQQVAYLLNIQRDIKKARRREFVKRRDENRVEDLFWIEIDDLNRSGGKLS